MRRRTGGKGRNNIVDNMTKLRTKLRKTRQVRIEESLWKKLKLEAIKKGITMSKLLDEKFDEKRQ